MKDGFKASMIWGGFILAAFVLTITAAIGFHRNLIRPERTLPVNVDAIVGIDTQADTVYLVDSFGVQVGSVTFKDEITVTLKRKK